LRDPDQNGVELYWDRPRKDWPHSPDGTLTMFTRPLDLDSLLARREGFRTVRNLISASQSSQISIKTGIDEDLSTSFSLPRSVPVAGFPGA
jgi:catechol-2,3-dioxygenase